MKEEKVKPKEILSIKMTKRVLISTLVCLFFTLLALLYIFFTKSKINTGDDIYRGFKLETEYISNNTWEYTVTGKFPNSCYTAKIDTIIEESFPEHVIIIVEIIDPKEDMVCAQVITDFRKEGTFYASEDATVDMKIE